VTQIQCSDIDISTTQFHRLFFFDSASLHCSFFKNSDMFKSLLIVQLLVAFGSAFRSPENPAAIKPPVIKPTEAVSDIFPASEGATISNDMLLEVGRSIASQKFVKHRRATERKQWGIDNDVEDYGEYWFDSRIHTFGNTGFLGALHAAMAPLSTKVIDIVAYDGKDVRSMVCPYIL
jgi:hypothetical protein